MAITVGTDTYLTLSAANTYIADNYISTSTEYTTWSALSDANKELYLKKATKKIDRQQLRGIKAVSTQTLEFPRAIRTDYYYIDVPAELVRYENDWVVESAASQFVKDAQVEEALALAVNEGSSTNKRLELQAQGVKSFRLGELSETYGKTTQGATRLISSISIELLRYYMLSGGIIL